MRQRVVIHSVSPEIEGGRYYVKRVPGERVTVACTAFGDGHDHIRCALKVKHEDAKDWDAIPMREVGQDRWAAAFTVAEQGFYKYEVEGWVDQLLHWREGFRKKAAAGQHLAVELEIGARLIERTAKQYGRKRAAKQLRDLAARIRDAQRYPDAVREVLSDAFAKPSTSTRCCSS